MRRTNTRRRPFDARTIAEGFRGPGMDPRQWCSMGRVHAKADQELVVFDQDLGAPIVRVTLEPTKVPVSCRVSSMMAGNGEGEWPTFIEGEEVVVLIPEGNERAGCVIVGKLNNALDRFPMESVAGQDPTTNSFAFSRRRTPYVVEQAGPLMWREALTGAFLSIDKTGNITLRDGQRSAFQMSGDAIGFQGPSNETTPPRAVFQYDLNAERITMAFGNSMLQMNAAGQNWLVSPTQFVARQGADFPGEHVATVEFVLAMLGVVSRSVTLLGGGEPSTGGAIQAAINLAVAAGGAPLMPTDAAPLLAGLAVAGATPKPPPVGVQMLPKLGAVNFLTG